MSEIAMEWLNTPYRWACAVKGKGIDCERMVTECAKEFGALPPGYRPPFQLSRDWNLANSEQLDKEVFSREIEKWADRYPIEQRQVNDVILMKDQNGTPCHMGILMEGDIIIHAVCGDRVRRHPIRSLWTKIVCAYRVREMAAISPASENGR